MEMSDEEIIETGKILAKAYYLGCDYGEHSAQAEANSVRDKYNSWAKQAQGLADQGYSIPRTAGGSLAGRTMAGDALLRNVEQLAENVKATLDALEKSPTPNKKAITQWRHTLNALVGAPHKRGLLPDLKEAGPGSY